MMMEFLLFLIVDLVTGVVVVADEVQGLIYLIDTE